MSATAARTAFVALALLILWRVAQVNFVHYDDAGRPRLASAAAAAPSAPAADRAFLRQVLHANPANVEALLLLAREHERAGDLGEARRAYRSAFELAPRERSVLAAGSEFFLRQGAFADAIVLLDSLVESYPASRGEAFPVLARLLVERRDSPAWNDIAVRRPAWLGPFIIAACERGTDPAHLVRLFLDRVAVGRATAEETACIVDRLRDSDRWQQAYQVWLNTLPRERLADVGHVFNGGFEHAASGVGFDWRPTRARERDTGHSVEVSQGPGVTGKRALRVSFNGKRQMGVAVAQYLALAPGRYELSGLARPQSVTAGRGVQWTVRCVKGGKPQAPLAASERFVGSSEWRRFVVDVAVPADCPGQLLQLEAIGTAEGPVFLAGTAWFDELMLRRRG